MTEKTAYEYGARALKPRKGPDPNDEFSQKAAKNKEPPLGLGLTEKTSERSETDKSDLRDGKGGKPEADAQGQSEKRHAGGSNDGVSSANPRVLSGSEEGDATFPYKSKR
ncbi:hypothetical protein [Mesorhizobium sp. YM1C-6-2]|uniref:hypothetical protein n=1 Tax=Mesorhizobium sp. YM1C-6-2 TaxID=1827501 RepID=UPI000EF1C587|nr:hypothetical protein [Mesorhizobium sp. YM1C-6-2]RLP22132.1 hypothetical protein D8676_25735 [Mesorhizobium sp. YM1C-6-2]